MLKIQIEGLGLHDLLRHSERPFIHTPLSAEVTFRDDPLRLLRRIWFASQFEGTIHEEIFAAARNTVIRVSRSHHVSLKSVDIVCTIGSADDEDQP
jgi:tRNA nucleotidyltransferase/poly(A) polymerase